MEKINIKGCKSSETAVPFLQENKTKLNLVISNRIGFLLAKFLENLLTKNLEDESVG